MFSRFKQPEIWCDAPPYAVVRACEECGFHAPLDVRWCRISGFCSSTGEDQGRLVYRLWQWLFRSGRRVERSCTCGQPLPDLKKHTLSVLSEKVGDYLLGQCQRCHTMFWDAAVPLPAWMEEGVMNR